MLRTISKALAAASAAVAVAVAAGLITGQAEVWITGAVSVVATFITTYMAPANATSARTALGGVDRTAP